MMADCKSAETPSGAEETYPTERNFISINVDIDIKKLEMVLLYMGNHTDLSQKVYQKEKTRF